MMHKTKYFLSIPIFFIAALDQKFGIDKSDIPDLARVRNLIFLIFFFFFFVERRH